MSVHRWARRGFVTLALLTGVVAAGSPLATIAADGSYTVSDGDTLSEIALAHNTTLEQLIALNDISDPDLIVTGETLILPDAWSAASSTAAAADDWTANTWSDDDDSESDWSDVADDGWYGDGSDEAWVDPPYVDQATVVAMLTEAAEMYGWDPSLILAQAWQESRWRQDGVSEAGAIGVMQVLPGTAAEIGDWYLGREVDPWNNVWDNIESGVAFLTVLYQETGSVETALAAYYQGLGSLERDGWYPDTEDYVNLIYYWQELIQNGDL